jgi:hypothetical protein
MGVEKPKAKKAAKKFEGEDLGAVRFSGTKKPRTMPGL